MFEGPDNQALAWPLCLTGSSSPQLLMWAGFRGYQLLREAEKVVWSCSQLPFHISIRPLAGRPSQLMLHCRSLMFFSLQLPKQRCNISLSRRVALHACPTAQPLQRRSPSPHICVSHSCIPATWGVHHWPGNFFSLFSIFFPFFFSPSEYFRTISRNKQNALIDCRYWDD